MASQAASSRAMAGSGDAAAGAGLDQSWRQQLTMLAVALLLIGALYWRDVADMAMIWWNISTYNHCLLIVPILGWLVQQRAEELRKIAPAIWWPGLLYCAAAGFGWLLGEAAGVAVVRHLGVIMLAQGAVITLLGYRAALGLLFPLTYAFFLLPVGEEIVPQLQMITADLSMLFLGWAHIPAHIEGVFISTPTGYFEVAEACSGIMFLVAMIAYGTLVSALCFRTWHRRALFMLACAIVPIIANGIRAFGTIWIAHHHGIEFAAGFDHILYGWFFFAFVLAAVMALGWPFFDRQIDEPMINGEQLAAMPLLLPGKSAAAKPMAAVLALLLIAPVLWVAAISASGPAVPARIALPEVPGWQRSSSAPDQIWRARFDGASHLVQGRYHQIATGRFVDLAIAVYDRQEEGREIVGYGQGGFDPDSQWAWSKNVPAPDRADAFQLTAPGPVLREVVTYYHIGGALTGSTAKVKLATLKAKLLGDDPRAVAILISAERSGDDAPRASIDAFTRDLGDLNPLADHMAGRE